MLEVQAVLRAGRAATGERLLQKIGGDLRGNLSWRWLLGTARLDQGDVVGSIELLEGILAVGPLLVEPRVDLARALRRVGRVDLARDAIRRVLGAIPRHHRAWLAYGDILVDLAQYTDAREAFKRAQQTDPQRQLIERATAALLADDRKNAEAIFRGILQNDASHAAAICGLAAVSVAADRPHDAERLLRHALTQCAYLPLAWRGLGPALLALGRLTEAESTTRLLLKLEPLNPQTLIVLAGVCTRLMRQEEALDAYERAARLMPHEVRLWMSIGHVNKTLGRRRDSEAAYKTALDLKPGYAEAYWSLADLKNYQFGDVEMKAMEQVLLDRPSVLAARSDEAQLHFALGKALEQRHDYSGSFSHYAKGNALRRLDAPFDVEQFERRTQRIVEVFDANFFAERRGGGAAGHAPIFIVGLPRSGSTLLEQILASHPKVQGTMELPNILNYVGEFDDLLAGRNGYPDTVLQAPTEAFKAFGERYLHETLPLRGARERFTDKLPNNFSHVGLIHAILPDAVIIDARRRPMDCCLSVFKQYFAEGQTFSYDLETLGRYYRCYLKLMAHWDAVLPGKVLRVQYESMVADPPGNIRRLLAHCALNFEPACLNFHENKRAVRTASAEQVRQPIYSSALDYAKNFAAELAPLRQALGDAVER